MDYATIIFQKKLPSTKIKNQQENEATSKYNPCKNRIQLKIKCEFLVWTSPCLAIQRQLKISMSISRPGTVTWVWKITQQPLVNDKKKRWKDPPFLVATSTISMANFNSKLLVYPIKSPFIPFISHYIPLNPYESLCHKLPKGIFRLLFFYQAAVSW